MSFLYENKLIFRFVFVLILEFNRASIKKNPIDYLYLKNEMYLFSRSEMCAALSAKTTGASNGAPSDEWGEKTMETLQVNNWFYKQVWSGLSEFNQV